MSRWSVLPSAVVVGDLHPDEQREAERLLADDPAFRAEVERLRSAVAVLAAGGAPATAATDIPALDLERALAARPAASSVRPDRPVGRAWRRTVLPAFAVGVASLGVGIVVGRWTDDPSNVATRPVVRPAGPPPVAAVERVALVALPGSPRQARAVASLDPSRPDGDVVLRGSGLLATPAGHFYELWLMTSRRSVTSVGTFRVGLDGNVRLRFHVGAVPDDFRYLDVSLERDDGRPEHSGASVLRSGPLS